MKQAVIGVLLVLLLSYIMSGGFSVRNQAAPFPSADPRVATLLGEGDQTNNDRALQLRTLKFTIPTPSTSSSPGPTVSPSSQPTPSPTPASCVSRVAIDFLLDVSGSMDIEQTSVPAGQRKIDYLKTAMIAFGDRLEQTSLVGIQVFSGPTITVDGSDSSMCYPNSACEILPIGTYNSSQYQQEVSSLRGRGQTPMKDAFILAKQRIDSFRASNPQYNDYEWYLVFLSDGFPVPALTQWPFPRGPQQPLDVVTPIKNLPNMKIVSIGLGTPGDDYDQGLMTQIATSPQYFHGSLTGNNLGSVFQQIFNQVCP
jgi:uncharacterized protein YegL